MSSARDAHKAANARALRYAVYGLCMGFGLSRMGFSDYLEVHKMFTFEELRLFLAFMVGTGVSAIAYLGMKKLRNLQPKVFNPGSVIGGIIFGVGWAVTGACPSAVLVQLGEGKMSAIASTLGVLVGTWIYPKVHKKFFSWDMGSCSM